MKIYTLNTANDIHQDPDIYFKRHFTKELWGCARQHLNMVQLARPTTGNKSDAPAPVVLTCATDCLCELMLWAAFSDTAPKRALHASYPLRVGRCFPHYQG